MAEYEHIPFENMQIGRNKIPGYVLARTGFILAAKLGAMLEYHCLYSALEGGVTDRLVLPYSTCLLAIINDNGVV